ncbi:hypothetical protein SCAR479_01564 [Seiridium cardinale]|uniref:Uncharacterized protein n=1 Tax=Seiridium cardinale TaxID=138064 RepID=A0ABR2Y5T1_9PEZI
MAPAFLRGYVLAKHYKGVSGFISIVSSRNGRTAWDVIGSAVGLGSVVLLWLILAIVVVGALEAMQSSGGVGDGVSDAVDGWLPLRLQVLWARRPATLASSKMSNRELKAIDMVWEHKMNGDTREHEQGLSDDENAAPCRSLSAGHGEETRRLGKTTYDNENSRGADDHLDSLLPSSLDE